MFADFTYVFSLNKLPSTQKWRLLLEWRHSDSVTNQLDYLINVLFGTKLKTEQILKPMKIKKFSYDSSDYVRSHKAAKF